MSTRKIGKLSLIPRLHKLLQHLNFLFWQTKFQVYLSCNFTGGIHATRNINTEYDSRVVISCLLLQSTLKHIYNIFFHWDLLFLYEKFVGVIAKLAYPEALVRF